MRNRQITLGYSYKRKWSGTITTGDSRLRGRRLKLEACTLRPSGKWGVGQMRCLTKSRASQGMEVWWRPSLIRHTASWSMSRWAARKPLDSAKKPTKKISLRTVIRNQMVTNLPKSWSRLQIRTTLMCARTTGQMIPTPTQLQRSTVLPTSSRGRKRRPFMVSERIAARPHALIRPWKVQSTTSQIWPSTAIIWKSRAGQKMFLCTMRDMLRSKTSH